MTKEGTCVAHDLIVTATQDSAKKIDEIRDDIGKLEKTMASFSSQQEQFMRDFSKEIKRDLVTQQSTWSSVALAVQGFGTRLTQLEDGPKNEVKFGKIWSAKGTSPLGLALILISASGFLVATAFALPKIVKCIGVTP